MRTTLALDACTGRGTVAVIVDGRVAAEAEVAMRGQDSEQLLPAVAGALLRGDRRLADVDRIVCGAGPGSFTSLRIAASLAKGMAIGAAKPLFAVPSLALVVAGNPAEHGRYLAALDALRGERFVAVYDVASAVRQVEPARLVPASEVRALAEREDARVVGPDDAGGWMPHARGVRLLDDSLMQGPVDLSGWEPTYGRLAEAQARWEAAHGAALPR